VLATLYALAAEKSPGKNGEKRTENEAVSPRLLEKAIHDLGIDSEKLNPAIS